MTDVVICPRIANNIAIQLLTNYVTDVHTATADSCTCLTYLRTCYYTCFIVGNVMYSGWMRSAVYFWEKIVSVLTENCPSN